MLESLLNKIAKRLFPKAKMIVTSFSNNQDFRFRDLAPQQKGVIGFTVQNTGESTILIDDQSQQLLQPGESFTTPENLIMTNEIFRLKFIDELGQNKKGVVRYYILENECN